MSQIKLYSFSYNPLRKIATIIEKKDGQYDQPRTWIRGTPLEVGGVAITDTSVMESITSMLISDDVYVTVFNDAHVPNLSAKVNDDFSEVMSEVNNHLTMYNKLNEILNALKVLILVDNYKYDQCDVCIKRRLHELAFLLEYRARYFTLNKNDDELTYISGSTMLQVSLTKLIPERPQTRVGYDTDEESIAILIVHNANLIKVRYI